MFKYKILFLSIFFVVLTLSMTVHAAPTPVELLMQVKGDVFYSHEGGEWKAVHRNKYLFPGDQIKTENGGSGRLINQKKQQYRTLGPNTLLKINDDQASLVSGTSLSDFQALDELSSSVTNLFSNSQMYTTKRRSILHKETIHLETIQKITLSNTYPELIWEELGPQYSYRLTIDDHSVDIHGTNNEIVRYKISELSPGEHPYKVELLKDGKVIESPKKATVIRWLSHDEMEIISQEMEKIRHLIPDDDLILASYLEEKGLAVAAMDMYQKYFKENPEDVDMRPMMIQSYYNLKLTNLRKKEMINFSSSESGK
ncbi:MAG: hypothetical protein H7832_00760 [Magnetococcus sp. DMHC-6]